jgi:hypothetical protein
MTHNEAFSFDLYPGIDAELDAAFARNVGQEPTAQLGATGIAAAVTQHVASGNKVRTDFPEGYLRDFVHATTIAEELFESNVPFGQHTLGEFLSGFESTELDYHVANAYEAMRKLGFEPQIIIGPSSASKEWWQGVYKDLPGTKNGGLYIDQSVGQVWSELPSPSDANWFVSVVPATSKPTIISDHMLNWHNQPAVEAIATSSLPFGTRTEMAVAHTTIAEYLTLQATKLTDSEPPIDSETYTWLSGTFDNGTKAPYGYWFPDVGQVRLRWNDPSSQSDGIGARPAVRGTEL